jgi:hypothetical protein
VSLDTRDTLVHPDRSIRVDTAMARSSSPRPQAQVVRVASRLVAVLPRRTVAAFRCPLRHQGSPCSLLVTANCGRTRGTARRRVAKGQHDRRVRSATASWYRRGRRARPGTGTQQRRQVERDRAVEVGPAWRRPASYDARPAAGTPGRWEPHR